MKILKVKSKNPSCRLQLESRNDDNKFYILSAQSSTSATETDSGCPEMAYIISINMIYFCFNSTNCAGSKIDGFSIPR